MGEKSGLLADHLTTAELASECHVTTRTIYNWVEAGLPYVKLGARRLFKFETTQRWIAGLETRKNEKHPARRRSRRVI